MSYLIRWRAIQVCVLVVLAVATFGSVVTNQFFGVDDAAFIEDNEIDYPLNIESFSNVWTRSTLGLYVPVPNLVWGLIAKFSRTNAQNPPKLGYARYPDQRFNPYVFHLVSLICHIFTGVLIHACLIRLGMGSWGAFLGAGVFLFHPVQVESVAWASLLKDSLSMVFSAMALLLYITHVDAKTKTHSWLLYALAFSSYLVALCSKPGAVMLPLILGLIGLGILKRPARRLIAELIPWALCAIPIMIVTTRVQLEDAAVQFDILDAHLRPLIALDSLTFYLMKLVWPLDLTFDYGRSPSRVLSSAWTLLTWIPPLLLALFIYLRRSQFPFLVVAYGIFVIGLLPTLGLRTFSYQAFSTVTDHYLGLSMLGVAIGVGSSFQYLISRDKIGLTPFVIGLSILGLLCVKSNFQLKHWKDSHAIYQQALNVNSASWFSYRMLGLERELDDQPDEALAFYRKSMSINGNTYGHSGLFARLNASEDFERAYEVISDVVDEHQRDIDYLTRANISYRLGRFKDASRDLNHARQLDPSPEMSARITRALHNLNLWTPDVPN